MNIYLVQFKKSNCDQQVSVAANTAERAIQDAERYLKSKYYSYEITGCTRTIAVEVFYKSAPKKATKKKK